MSQDKPHPIPPKAGVPGVPPRKALGRGLESLIPAARTITAVAAMAATPAIAPAGEAIREIPVEQIAPNPYQTREHVDEAALEELAASIAASGVLQPVVVRPIPLDHATEDADGKKCLYQLIAGERRWLASQRAGKKTVPAIVRQVSSEQAMEMTIIENLQREDLNPLEQARAFERLAREFHLTQEQMAQRTGKTRSSVANYLRLLKVPEKVQTALAQDYISFGHAKVLMMLDSAELMVKALNRVLQSSLSVRQTEQLVQQILHPAEKGPAPAPEPYVDPNVRAAERAIREALGLRVQIKDRNGRGKIVIEYASLEDFDRVVDALGRH
jgi:ParB family chromosome partitioning protein